ncbi:hypothetical protein HAX54_039595 [Datura stramonium]|uniref:Uncharacterized protein n=1 Tax=Datura stramonium TaxID=4076 RepID=A0ABS8VMU8_DATST|nr:hypothetical protein [Datura stramonium]
MTSLLSNNSLTAVGQFDSLFFSPCGCLTTFPKRSIITALLHFWFAVLGGNGFQQVISERRTWNSVCFTCNLKLRSSPQRSQSNSVFADSVPLVIIHLCCAQNQNSCFKKPDSVRELCLELTPGDIYLIRMSSY